MGIAVSIYRIARDAVASQPPGRLCRVRVAVGELSAVEPDLLRYAWEAVTAEGVDAGAELDVDWCRARQFCPSCNEEKDRTEGGWLRLCPDCAQPLRVEGGTELDVVRVEYDAEEDDEQGC
jgi:Zn finger protein HypA/HybF involved in hydrogenase expression